MVRSLRSANTPPPPYTLVIILLLFIKKIPFIKQIFFFLIGLKISKLILIQGNSRKGLGRCRISCLLHYIHDLSIPLHTISWDDISRSLFANSPEGQSFAFYFFLSVSRWFERIYQATTLLYIVHGDDDIQSPAIS